jgi:hypothetical protein
MSKVPQWVNEDAVTKLVKKALDDAEANAEYELPCGPGTRTPLSRGMNYWRAWSDTQLHPVAPNIPKRRQGNRVAMCLMVVKLAGA